MRPAVTDAFFQRLHDLLNELFSGLGADYETSKIAGDASNRIYYRLRLKNGAPVTSVVAMCFPPEAAFLSDEVTGAAAGPKRHAFLDMAAYLARRELPVPAVYGVDLAAGLILLEDLGDTLLYDEVITAAPALREAGYRDAIDLWRHWLLATADRADRDTLAFSRRFDPALLLWECEHYLEWGIEALYRVTLTPSEREATHAAFTRLSDELTALPQVLVHRDFQSRNLLRRGSELALIDFQDALLGPLPYDLVALLRDSYIVLSPLSRDRLLDYAHASLSEAGLTALSAGEFRRAFFAQTIQRKLKDAGRFVFIERRKRNPWFLQHIPASLGYVREAFAKCPDYADLLEILGRYETRLLP